MISVGRNFEYLILALAGVLSGLWQPCCGKNLSNLLPPPRRLPRPKPTEPRRRTYVEGGTQPETNEDALMLSRTLATGSSRLTMVDPQDCNSEFIVSDSSSYLLYSNFEPNAYNCSQSFLAEIEGSTLQLICPVFSLRFNCAYEFLQIMTDDTVFKFCGKNRIPTMSGNFFTVRYKRSLFSIHGGYICFIMTTSETEDINTGPPTDFKECKNCGIGNPELPSRSLQRMQLDTRIVNGVPAKRAEYPWMVLLGINVRGEGRYACGGSMVTESLVITAAHCVDLVGITDVQMYLGRANLDQYEADSVIVTLGADAIRVHEGYDEYSLVNDIAVIKLETPLSSNHYIKPICLPSDTLGNLVSLTATATGWGTLSETGNASRTLQTVQLGILSNQRCQNKWGDSPIMDSHICAYGVNKDTCFGDSGGPLIVQLQSRWILVGITSYGIGCATEYPGVYTRVSAYLDWIGKFIEPADCQ